MNKNKKIVNVKCSFKKKTFSSMPHTLLCIIMPINDRDLLIKMFFCSCLFKNNHDNDDKRYI